MRDRDGPEPDRIRGCLLAGAIGDAAGFRYENAPPDDGRSIAAFGVYSDDTQLTLATATAIVERGGRVDPEAIARSFVEQHRRDPIRGIGAATAKAIRELSVGGHWALVGRKGQMAAGNGAAIRIAPLAFVLDPRVRRSRTTIRDVSRITHHSDEAYAGALAACLAVHDAMRDRTLDLTSIAAEMPDTAVRDRILELEARDLDYERAAAELGATGHVVDSVPLALVAATRIDEHGFVDMLERIVRSGGDCDSIASMAGQIWGARYGAGALPSSLVDTLSDRERVERVARELSGIRA